MLGSRKRSARSLAAEAAFRQCLAELAAVPAYEEWLGISKPHAVRCEAGHDCQPRPANVAQGQGICRRCGNRQTDRAPTRSAEAAFLDALSRIGATPLYDQWAGVDAGHHVRCSAGHDCWPQPYKVSIGRGICRVCSGRDRVAAEAEFRARLTAIGATPAFEQYLGSNEPHQVVCAAGHSCTARPGDLKRGRGVCITCAGLDPAVSEAQFRARLAELGATPLFAEWRGVVQPHLIRCAQGHESSPYPCNVRRGEGICRTCAHRAWDVFYVVASRLAVKFGITSGDPRERLYRHAFAGYATVVRLAQDLPGTLAPDAEKAVRSALAMAGERPIRGNEYFDISCLGLVVDVTDGYLATGGVR